MPTVPAVNLEWSANGGWGFPRPLSIEIVKSSDANGFYYLIGLWRGPASLSDAEGNAFAVIKTQGNLSVFGRFYAGPFTDKHIRIVGASYANGFGLGFAGATIGSSAPVDQVSGVTHAGAAYPDEIDFDPITPSGMPFYGLALVGAERAISGWTIFTQFQNVPPFQWSIRGAHLGNQSSIGGTNQLTSVQWNDFFFNKNGYMQYGLSSSGRGFGGPLGSGTPPWLLGNVLTAYVACFNTVAADFDLILLNILGAGYSGGGGGGDPNAGAGTGPWCWADRDGAFHIAKATAAGIVYLRTDYFTGGIVSTAAVTLTATDLRPRMVRLPYSPQRLVLVFERGGAIYRSDSFDDGATWTTPASVLASCTKPTISIHPNGTLLIAGKTAAHKLQGMTQAPGETSLSAAFTFQDSAGADLVFADDVFHLVGEATGPGRWLLVTQSGGNIGLRRSADDGASWGSSTTALTSCTKPTIALHPNGTLLILGKTSAHKLKGVTQTPGETALSTPFTIQNDAAADIVIGDDVFHVAPESQGPGRWQLVAQVAGAIVRYVSADDSLTYKVVT
jgi:hypothetical protein